ncbi:major facilitator superfamily domain-containing protein [Hyaloraphidium curvatum]|nr:major facilitator superfamily domain-containing protein [Hyaloraphidium curvatum]
MDSSPSAPTDGPAPAPAPPAVPPPPPSTRDLSGGEERGDDSSSDHTTVQANASPRGKTDDIFLEPVSLAGAVDEEEARNLAEELISSGQFPEGTGMETMILAEKGQIPPKEGGYGWVIVFAVFLSTLMVVGLPSAWGVYQRQFYYENYFAGASNLQIAFVGALEPAVQMALGPISGRLGDQFGPRTVCAVGALLMSGGLVASSFCNQLWQLYITFGLVAGSGASFSWIPAAATTPKWFVKKRGLAVGLAASGGGFGGLMLGPLAQYLMDHMGWQWAMRITGLIALGVLMLCAVLMRLPPGMSLAALREMRKGRPFIDGHVIRHASFLRLFFIGALIAFAYFIAFAFMPSFAYENGFSKQTGALLTAVMNGVAGVGRILIGLGSDYLGIFNTMCVVLLLPALANLLLWPFSGPYLGLQFVFAVVYGFFSGGYIVMLPIATAHRFGPQTLATVLGMLNLAWAPGFLLGSPIAGAITDANTQKDPATGEVIHVEWWPVQLYAGALFVCCFLLALWERLKESRVLMKKC